MAGQIQRDLQNGKPLASLEVELFLNIQRTAEMMTAVVDGVLATAGIQTDEYNVLRILRGAGDGGRTAADVRSRMVRDTGRFPALVHALRTRGLVAGTLTLSITPTGVALLGTLTGRVDEAIRARMAGIKPADLRLAVETLERVRTCA